MRSAFVWCTLLCTACGGSAGKPADSPTSRDDGGPASLGIEGGIDALGAPPGVKLGPPLYARLLLPSDPVKLDGLVREWHALSDAKVTVSGNPSVALSAALQYDTQKIYLAADVDDDVLQRTGKFAATEDHVSLVLAFPTERGFTAYEIGFFAGKPGESAGSVRFLSGPKKGREVPQAKIVEAPKKGEGAGYTLEASIPWSSFPEAAHARLGLRGALRLVDASGVIGTGEGDAEHADKLPQLLTEPEVALMEGLLNEKGLGDTAPSFDVLADITGDADKERIAVYGSILTITGHRYRGGSEFFFRDMGGEIQQLQARPFSGKSKSDLFVRHKVRHPHGVAEVMEVWTFPGDEPQPLFAQEAAIQGGNNRLSNSIRFEAGSALVRTEPAVGSWTAETYKPYAIAGVSSLLLPWGEIKSRRYALEGGQMVVADEEHQTPAPGARTATAQTAPLPRDLPSPAVKQSSDLSAELLAAFRKERGIAASTAPRFNLETDLAEDGKPERAALFGRDLVVLGPGFRGGRSYVYITLDQFARDEDVAELTAKDLTGDNKAELIVRGTRRLGNGGEEVSSEALFVYQLQADGLRRVFGIETARAQSGKRVQGMVQFVPSQRGAGFEIDVRPGVAKGFAQASYPWNEEAPGGALEPLLLPWGKQKALRYRFEGGRFALAQP